MSELRSADLRRALELVYTIGSAPDRARFRRMLLRELRALVPADSVVHHEFDLRHGGNAILEEPAGFHGREVMEDAPERLMGEHPIADYVARSGDPHPVRLSDVTTQRRWHRNPIYDVAFRPHGLEHQMGFVVNVMGTTTAALALNRSRPDFSERECELVDVLRPHVEQAFANASLRELVSAVEEDAGVVLLSPLGRIESSTPRAQGLLAAHLGAAAAAGTRLPELIERWLAGGQSGPLTLATRRGRLRVHLVSDATLVLQEPRTELDPAALVAASLTRREIEVLQLVARGLASDAIARELAISPRTVQKHLERIHVKLGVASRTAAVARALELSRVRGIAH